MKIINIEKIKGTLHKITFADLTTIDVDYSVLYFNKIKIGICLDESKINEIKFEEQLRIAKKKALNMLSIKDYSSDQLYKKLSEKFDEHVCANVLSKMTELGYLDDHKYAIKLVHYCFETKKWSKKKTYFYLLGKGLASSVISEALENAEYAVTDNIISIINKKYINRLDDYNEKQKVIAALSRQGYNYSDIKNAIEQIKNIL